MFFDGENAYKVVETEDGLLHVPIALENDSSTDEASENSKIERYSVDDHGGENFADIQVELEASNRQWSEMFLQDRLGVDGVEKYRQWQKQQAEQKKKQDRDGKKQTELKDDI